MASVRYRHALISYVLHRSSFVLTEFATQNRQVFVQQPKIIKDNIALKPGQQKSNVLHTKVLTKFQIWSVVSQSQGNT